MDNYDFVPNTDSRFWDLLNQLAENRPKQPKARHPAAPTPLSERYAAVGGRRRAAGGGWMGGET
eukprot:COSAG02_NODE_743_length_17764_cov_9.908916_1_plen_64_part_00